MKKILSLLVLFPMMVFAQTQTENYIKTTTYKVAATTSITNPAITQANQNVVYFDGLGRPIQQIAHQQSGSGKDIVTPIDYDGFGRQPIEYLPYVPNVSASLDYKSTALTDVFNFPQYIGQTPYSKKQLEASPLNRVLRQAAPGNDWALDSGHEIKLDYQTNTTTDAVRLFSITANWDVSKGLYEIPTSLSPTDYLEFQLYKNITYDENTAATPTESNGSTVEFKNKEGQVVLKRTYESGVKHDTYYVYDQYGNLTFVIPPLVDATSTITQTILEGLCYQYKYDYRNRLVEKKLPGKQWEFIVYDKLDRVVATGPAFSPFSDSAVGAIGWMITKYDVFSRPIYTGWELSATITPADRKSKQNTMDGLTTLSESKTTTPTTIDSLTGIVYYTNNVVPTSFKLLTVNYYDDYDFQAFTPAIAYTTPVAYNNSSLKPKGLPTGSWVRALTTLTSTAGERSYILYDDKARAVKTFSTNYLGGYTQIDSNLDAFSGRLNYTETRHKRGSGYSELYVKETYTYTAQDRLSTHTHQINALPVQLLAENSYDELGQLISKNVGNTTVAPLQKVDYAYNIRGWLTGINNDPTDNLVLNASEKDLFAFKINYNTTAGSIAGIDPLYNGNISETYWRTGSDNVLRKYGYQYDNLNRLKNAIYQKPGGNTYPTYEDYSEKNITYDKNGNIQTLYRNGDFENALPVNQIDNLSYTYQANSNKLALVYDSSNNTSGFKDGNLVGDDYTYDSNGNLLTDKNKNITGIVYNHLNLPVKITFGTTGIISYIYNAVGQKLQKDVNPILSGLTRAKTVYLSGFQYIETTRITKPPRPPGCARLQYFPTAEGYVENIAGFCATEVYSYVYNYADHLGNVRLSYKDTDKNGAISSNEILEENNYYPFGLKHKGYNSNNAQPDYKYKYNGKELQDELGLDMYAMDVRQYDPAIGKWTVIDPVTHYTESPYSAFSNNPIYFADPSGASPIYNSTTGQYVINGKQVSFDEAMSYANSGGNSDGSNNNNESETNNSDAKNGDNPNIKFPKGGDYEKKYPRLTKILQQVHDYVKNNSDLLYYLSYYSGYSTMEVLEKLEYGKGTELQSWFYDKDDEDLNGWTPNTGNFITVNSKFVNGLEIAKTNETIQGTSFLLMTTILHEFIHSSRVKNNLSDYPAEYGKSFEKYGFGQDINKYNANESYKKNGWNFKY
jgi:RHS repeat-associated protein